MAKSYRQNTSYSEIMADGKEDGEGEASSVNHGNTRLPFGLCERYGINLPSKATPRDAWNALKGKGITPEQVYVELDKKANSASADKNSDASASIERMVSDSRVVYSKRFTKERMLSEINAGNAEMRDVTVSLFNDDSFGYNSNERDTAYFPGFNKVCIRKSEEGGTENSPYTKGGTFYHETWHAIDDNYGERTRLSSDYVLSTGKTFNDTVKDECVTVNWTEVQQDISREIDDYYANQGLDRQRIISDYQKMKQRAEEIQKEVQIQSGNWFEGYVARGDFEKQKENIKLKKDYSTVSEIPKTIQRTWGDLSDIYCGYTKGKHDLVKMGHTKSYWIKGGSSMRGIEAFAECASAKATNPEGWKVLKKYMPNLTAGFEEIYDALRRGKIKSKGRPKYEP
ncbi:MAG: hypothetical protein K2K80_05675 [Clostridia bacterium]|nr:hypothetical protein [Clostridia bacterium]